MGTKGIPSLHKDGKKDRNLYSKKKNNVCPSSVGDMDLVKSLRKVMGVSGASHETCKEEDFGMPSKVASTINVLARRIVDVVMWFRQMAMLENHSQMGCRFSDFEVVSERLEGLRSGFTVKCKKCQCQSVVWTDDPEQAGGREDINLVAASSIIAIGGDYPELEELCERLNLQCMTNKAFDKHKKHLEGVSSGMNSAVREDTQFAEGHAVRSLGIHIPGLSIVPVTANGGWADTKRGSPAPVAGHPSVAEPVEVFVNVAATPADSSEDQEEVDPFEDVEKPMDDVWGKGLGKRPSEVVGQCGAGVRRFRMVKGGSMDAPTTSECDGQPKKFMAYSLQSDMVISSDDGEEVPISGLKSYFCSVESCQRIFDTLDDLKSHQRSCHLSVAAAHQAGSGRDWHRDEVGSGGQSIASKMRPSQKKWREMRSGNDRNTTILPDDGMGALPVQSTLRQVGGHYEASIGEEAAVKKECDEEDDVVCIESKFICKLCSCMFADESSLKKHTFEAHSKGKKPISQWSSEAAGNVGNRKVVQRRHGSPLVRKDSVGGPSGVVAVTRGSFGRERASPSSVPSNVEVTSLVGSQTGRIVGSDILVNRVPSQMGRVPSDGPNFGPRFALKSMLSGPKAGQMALPSSACDVCGKAYEFDGSAESSRSGKARVCRTCQEKLKPPVKAATNSNRHQCNLCGQTYSMKSALRRHERVHTGVRPYVCSVCGRTYTRNEYLRDHMKTHV